MKQYTLHRHTHLTHTEYPYWLSMPEELLLHVGLLLFILNSFGLLFKHNFGQFKDDHTAREY